VGERWPPSAAWSTGRGLYTMEGGIRLLRPDAVECSKEPHHPYGLKYGDTESPVFYIP
jgi:hypothetical protein